MTDGTTTSAKELVELSGGDVFLRSELRSDVDIRGFVGNGAAGWTGWRGPDRPRWLTVVGDPEAAVRLALRALEDAGTAARPAGVTLPRGSWDLLPSQVPVGPGTDWDWWWTERVPPAMPGRDQVGWLPADDATAGEIAALLTTSSPRSSSRPGDPDVVAWCGVRDRAGLLVAVAAHTAHGDGVPHLASIATHPDHRGRGLGAAVTSWVTGELLRSHPWVTLGMYADNTVARSMYRRLGFRDDRLFTSGRIAPA